MGLFEEISRVLIQYSNDTIQYGYQSGEAAINYFRGQRNSYEDALIKRVTSLRRSLRDESIMEEFEYRETLNHLIAERTGTTADQVQDFYNRIQKGLAINEHAVTKKVKQLLSNIDEDNLKNVLPQYICPLSLTLMLEPVDVYYDLNGKQHWQTYDIESVYKLVSQQHPIEPYSHQRIKTYRFNTELKEEINNYLNNPDNYSDPGQSLAAMNSPGIK